MGESAEKSGLTIPKRKHSILAQALANSITSTVNNTSANASKPGENQAVELGSPLSVDDFAPNKFDKYACQNSKLCSHYSNYTVSEILSAVAIQVERKEKEELTIFRDKIIRLFAASMFTGMPDGYEIDDDFSDFLMSQVEDETLMGLGFNVELPYIKASGDSGNALCDEFFDASWSLGDIVEAFSGGAVIIPSLYKDYDGSLESAGVSQYGGKTVFSQRAFVLAMKFVSESAVFTPFHQICNGGYVLYDCSPSRVLKAQDVKVVPLDIVRRMPQNNTSVILCESNHWGDDLYELVQECITLGHVDSYDSNVIVAITNKVDSMEHDVMEMFMNELGLNIVATVSANTDDIYPGYQKYGCAASFTRRSHTDVLWEYISDTLSFNMLSDGYYAGMLAMKLAELATTRVSGNAAEACDYGMLIRYLSVNYERILSMFSFGLLNSMNVPDVQWFQFDTAYNDRYFQQYDHLSKSRDVQLGIDGIVFYDLYDAYKSLFPSSAYQCEEQVIYCPTNDELERMIAAFLSKVRESGFKSRIENVCSAALDEINKVNFVAAEEELYDDDEEIFYTDDDDYDGSGMMQNIWRVSKPSSHRIKKKSGKKR